MDPKACGYEDSRLKNRTNSNYHLLKGSQPSGCKGGQEEKVKRVESSTQTLNLKEKRVSTKKNGKKKNEMLGFKLQNEFSFWRGRDSNFV